MSQTKTKPKELGAGWDRDEVFYLTPSINYSSEHIPSGCRPADKVRFDTLLEDQKGGGSSHVHSRVFHRDRAQWKRLSFSIPPNSIS